MRCDRGCDSNEVGIRECLSYERGSKLKLLCHSQVSPSNNQVTLCSPPYSRNMHQVVRGRVKGSINSRADFDRPSQLKSGLPAR